MGTGYAGTRGPFVKRDVRKVVFVVLSARPAANGSLLRDSSWSFFDTEVLYLGFSWLDQKFHLRRGSVKCGADFIGIGQWGRFRRNIAKSSEVSSVFDYELRGGSKLQYSSEFN